MQHVHISILKQAGSGSRYSIMRKTAIGLIDVCKYYEKIGDAFLDLLDLPKGDYELVKISREEVKS